MDVARSSVEDGQLEEDLARLSLDESTSTEAKSVLSQQYEGLVRAEGLLLERIGLDSNIAEPLVGELFELKDEAMRELNNEFPSARDTSKLRDVLCAHAGQLVADAERAASRRKVRGGILALCGVAIIGNGALALLTSGIALASTSAGGAIIGLDGKEILHN